MKTERKTTSGVAKLKKLTNTCSFLYRMKPLMTYLGLHLLCLALVWATVTGCDDVASSPTGIEKEECGRAENEPVAFTVGLTDATPCFSGNGATVPYDKVLLNHGGAFDTGTHHFIAPARGLYRYVKGI